MPNGPPNHENPTTDLARYQATREDIHRLRNEVQRLVGELQNRVINIDHTVTKLEASTSGGLTPIQIAQLLQLDADVRDMKREVEALKRRVYGAVGAMAVIGPALTLMVQNMLAK